MKWSIPFFAALTVQGTTALPQLPTEGSTVSIPRPILYNRESFIDTFVNRPEEAGHVLQ
jgi:hypothetical protein